jgi:hypothetical protein
MKARYAGQTLATHTGRSEEAKWGPTSRAQISQAESFHEVSLCSLEGLTGTILRDVLVGSLSEPYAPIMLPRSQCSALSSAPEPLDVLTFSPRAVTCRSEKLRSRSCSAATRRQREDIFGHVLETAGAQPFAKITTAVIMRKARCTSSRERAMNKHTRT